MICILLMRSWLLIMTLCKEQYTSEFLSLIKLASRISSVFVIPENSGFKIGKDVYYNKKIKHNKKVFYPELFILPMNI